MNDLKQKILSQVNADLQEIEKALAENLTPHLALVKDVAGHILFAGGKRLRPLLMVLSARMCDYQDAYVFRFSTIFEYLHAATLLHDDLVDDAELRRGRPVAHGVWDNSTAVLTGDYLLARALTIAADTRKPEIIGTIAWVTENMAQGEIHQLSRKGDIALAEAEYNEVIRCKTAVLFQGACIVSAQLADAPQEQIQALSDYGYHLGLAFQMADDLLDYTEDSQTLGKASGADLREGKLTLPVIHALAAATAEDHRFIVDCIRNPSFSDSDFEHIVDLLNQYGSIAYTRQKAHDHVARAVEEISRFPASVHRDLLNDIAAFALERNA